MNKLEKVPKFGLISGINGSLIKIRGLEDDIKLHSMIEVVNHNIIGEIIQIYSDHVIAQCFENTDQLKLKDKVLDLKDPISMELAPGLLSNIFDGIQRPLEKIYSKLNNDGFLERGVKVPSLSRTKKWHFTPMKKEGEKVEGGDILGMVQETPLIKHMIMTPPSVRGKLTNIAKEGDYTIIDEIYTIDGSNGKEKYSMLQKWPINSNRPYKKRTRPYEPLITGMRVIDLLFPLTKGGTVAVPGGFGTGKCVSPDTPVLLSNGEIRDIKDIYTKYSENNTSKIKISKDEFLIEIKDNLEVISFNKVQFKNKRATHIYKGKTNEIIKIKTRTGRTIKVTPIHKLHVFNGKDVIQNNAKHLKVGDYIAVPRKIMIDDSEIYFDAYNMDESLRVEDKEALEKMKDVIDHLLNTNELKDLAKNLKIPVYSLKNYLYGLNKPPLIFFKKLINFSNIPKIKINLLKAERQSEPFKIPGKLTEEIAEWLGLFVADGHIKGKYGGIYLYNTSKQILNRFKEITYKSFGLEAKYGQDSEDRTPYMYIRNMTFKKFLFMIGIPEKNKTETISIPPCILKSKTSILIHFLNGYYAGDGWFSNYTIGFSTISKNLHMGLSYLFSRLGVLYRISKKKNSYYIELEGKRSEQIGLLLRDFKVYNYDKLKPLFDYCDKKVKHFDSLDVIPVDKKILELIKQQGRDSQGHNIFRKYAGIRLDNYIKQEQLPTLTRLEEIFFLIKKYKPDIDKDVLQYLEYIINISQNIYFDKIDKINITNTISNVYDLTIEEYHNFIGGNNPVLLHNTVIQQNLAKWSDADVIVYCGVGERGNEIADVLTEFKDIIDPKSGRPLLERIVIIANTSNMPVSAREASIFAGVTIGEYYRDMGYNVAVLADSTSRWAEALREISGLLEEMPAEEGYPAYLPSKLSSFYERAGSVTTLGNSTSNKERLGSLSIIGSVSPPSGDFSEPVTATTKRFVQAFWALDASLAYSKHYPAINWLNSYSNYPDYISDWWKEKNTEWKEIPDLDWNKCRLQVDEILSQENELKNITQLIGKENLPEDQQLILFMGNLIRNSILIQSAFDDVDCFTDVNKLLYQIKLVLLLYNEGKELLKSGFIMEDIEKLNVINDIMRISKTIPNDKYTDILKIKDKMLKEVESLKTMFGESRERLIQ